MEQENDGYENVVINKLINEIDIYLNILYIYHFQKNSPVSWF